MPIRKLTTHCIIHCSATPPSMDIGVDEIDVWHRAKGWNGCGYHYIITRAGAIEYGRDLNTVGAHALGYNNCSVGICMIGGAKENDVTVPQNNFSDAQWSTLAALLAAIRHLHPGIKIIGHREVSDKECPSFDVPEYLLSERLDEVVTPTPGLVPIHFNSQKDYLNSDLCHHCSQPLLPF